MLSGILIILRRNRGDNIQWFLSKYTDVDSEILYVHKHNLMTVSHNPGPPQRYLNPIFTSTKWKNCRFKRSNKPSKVIFLSLTCLSSLLHRCRSRTKSISRRLFSISVTCHREMTVIKWKGFDSSTHVINWLILWQGNEVKCSWHNMLSLKEEGALKHANIA